VPAIEAAGLRKSSGETIVPDVIDLLVPQTRSYDLPRDWGRGMLA
jgi:hypothetical protein